MFVYGGFAIIEESEDNIHAGIFIIVEEVPHCIEIYIIILLLSKIIIISILIILQMELLIQSIVILLKKNRYLREKSLVGLIYVVDG
jgi:hypothetical protein